MNIITRESMFEYQMVNIIKKFKKDYGLENLDAEELQEEIQKNKYLSGEFGKAVLAACQDFSGDELFE